METPTKHLVVPLLLVGTLVLFIFMTKMFFIPFVISLTLLTLFERPYKALERLLGGRKGLSALIATAGLILLMLVPLVFIGQVFVSQAVSFYESLRELVGQYSSAASIPFIQKISEAPLLDRIDWTKIDWQSIISQSLSSVGNISSMLVDRTVSGTLEVVVALFIVFFSLFYFFKDREEMRSGITKLMPLRSEYVERLIKEFKSISRAAVKGTIVIGVIQGIVGSVTFIIVGIKGWVLWGVIMTILSVVPLVGSYFIMIPAALIVMVDGRIGAGIFIIFMALGVSYGVDYFLRPRLVGNDAKMHDLLVFVATIGGLSLFGLTGFIVGPVVAAMLVALLRIYSVED